ncbi:MAG: universal stress protein [Motiliproteus sp.]
MPLNHRILVAIKGSSDPQPVITRAKLIAHRLDAEVVLIAASRYLDKEAQGFAKQAEQELLKAGIAVQVYQRKLRDPLQELLQVATELQCGLLIKAPDRPRGLAGLLLTPRDWKLLRYAPCPVLIVKQAKSWLGRPILTSIDVAPGDLAHRQLNQQIVGIADQIARISESPLELISAYPTPMQSSTPSRQSSGQVAEHYQQQAELLCQQLAIVPDAVIIDEGPAETLIPAQVKVRDIALLVLGSVARRGVSAVLLGGNTAEAILSQIDCDVLCVQPQDGDQVLSVLHRADAELKSAEES